MKARITRILCTLLFFSGAWAPFSAHGAMEPSSQRTLDVEEGILDVAVSQTGRRIFVLTPEGQVLVLSGAGQREQRIDVGKNVDAIQAGPTDDTLVLTSRADKQIRVLVLDLVRQIDTSGSPFKGPANAPVVIAEFSEFQCPYCAKLAPVLDEVHRAYPEQVKIVFKHYPLKNHRFAVAAAAASLAADRQGAFWAFHDRLFKHYDSLSHEKIIEISRELGLDQTRFNRDMRDSETMKTLRRDLEEAHKAGVRGAPTVFVNGRMVKDRSPAGFKSLIEEELGKTKGGKSGD